MSMIADVVGNIGGNLGLWLGMSFMDVVTFCSFVRWLIGGGGKKEGGQTNK